MRQLSHRPGAHGKIRHLHRCAEYLCGGFPWHNRVDLRKTITDQETNKPVCYDCHGVHDIKRADDPEKGLQVKENLLVKCQKCHPDASDNFPTAWLSHYIPSPDHYPLVYYVNLFYKFFIPTVLGGMAILVVLDVPEKRSTCARNASKSKIPQNAPDGSDGGCPGSREAS